MLCSQIADGCSARALVNERIQDKNIHNIAARDPSFVDLNYGS